MKGNGTQPLASGRERRETHQFVQESLAWYVNGTLGAAEAQRVEAHIEVCGACREALAETRALAAALQAEERPHWSPSPQHFATLMERVDAAEALRTRATVPAPRWRRAWQWLAEGTELPRWAVAAPGVLSLALIAALFWDPAPAPSLYRTYSAPERLDTARGAEVNLQVYGDLEVGELQKLLAEVGATIEAGPSSVGHFRLRVANAEPAALAATLARLRAHPKVRLAEPVPGHLR